MRSEIRHEETHPLLAVGLDRGEALTAEAGAMVTTAGGIEIEATRGESSGMLSSLRRGTSSREAVRVVRFVAENGSGQVTLAPPLPGDIVRTMIRDEPVFVVQSGSFLGAAETVTVDATADTDQPLRGDEGLSFLRLAGSGPAFLAGYGAVESRRLDRSDSVTVNTGNVVAFTGEVTYDLETVEGLKSNVFQDEAVISRFQGPGQVWIQTRSHEAYLAWLRPHVTED